MIGSQAPRRPHPDSELLYAAGDGAPMRIVRALEEGADPRRARDHDGATHLMLAAGAAWAVPSIGVELLLRLSDANAVDRHGRNALFFAMIADNPDCGELLAPFTDLAHRDARGWSASEHLADAPRRTTRSEWAFLDAALAVRDQRAELDGHAGPALGKPKRPGI